MKSQRSILTASLACMMAATTAQAANLATDPYTDDIISTAVTGGVGDLWQQGATALTISSTGSVDIQSTSNTTNMTVGASTTSSITIDGGSLTFDGPNSLLIGNGGSASGTIDLRTGSFNANPGATLFIGRDDADGLVIIRGGAAVFGQQPTFDAVAGGRPAGRGSIDFADKVGGGTSDGTLTISGADLAYYQALYTVGDLTFNGSSAGNFGDVFEVSGTTLSAIPEPGSSVLLGLTAIGLFVRRRRNS